MRRILPILSFILLIAIQSQAQTTRSIPASVSSDRIIKLYPNPATTNITFDLQKGYEKGLSIQVYSFLGKKMYENQSVPSKITLDLSEYNRGLYMYHLIDISGKVIESGKFQVTK
ncbi:MAG TPA: T9SS type A sorting domain-containing protein [Chitinophagaceae bacterium]|nr:T9SS type A sorting domain-containing protein [Chitinophagaceae bacterium]